MYENEPWPELSAEAAGLLQQACQVMLASPDQLVELVDGAVESAAGPELTADPSLMELVRESNRSNLLHWARANLDRPGERVPANVGPVTLDIARDVVRRGLDEAGLQTYQEGQAVAWRYFMQMAFALTDDLGVLHELLDVGSRSIFAFVDDTVKGIQRQVEQERRDLVSGAGPQRLAAVRLLLEGAPISATDAERRLRYGLAGPHTAAIVWATEPTAGLERVVTAVARTAGVVGPLVVESTVRSIWVWFPVPAERLEGAWDLPATVRAAVGTTRAGVEGFRQSHLDAVATRELMGPGDQLVAFEEVQAASLAGVDIDRAGDFVERVLGPLAEAPEELRQTVRTWLANDCNVAATARALHVHRNTAVNRLDTAAALVPGGLSGRAVDVGLALELLRWPAT